MANENYSSIVLHEHRKIVTLRHLLALVNFIAILASTVVTRHFVLIRGTSDGVLFIINALCIINAVQIILCIIEYIIKIGGGKYSSALVKISYIVGVIWFGAVVAEFVSGSLVLGEARIDLGAIALLQLVSAILAYVAWPVIDSGTVNKMTNHKVRDDADKRAKKARGGVAKYVFTCFLMVVIQFGLLLAYKLPPKVYDLFSESRQLQYQLAEDGNSYEVIGVYVGTSTYVSVPDVYNNKPVTRIKSGALSNSFFSEANKIAKIDIGSKVTDEDGNTSFVSNIIFIEAGAIENDKITELTIPVSVANIDDGAIVSASLKKIIYEATAKFYYSYLNCSSLNTVIFSGVKAGEIETLDGMDENSVTILVPKDNYNNYRERNYKYMASIRPILADDEYVVDFYSGIEDYYIESIFAKVGENVDIKYSDLKNDKYTEKKAPTVDTLAYIANNHETGTDGAKKDSAFRGWYFDKSYTNDCKFDETNAVSISRTTSIYAKWIDEYTGTLDWGTYHPDNQPGVLYWTDEDPIKFPEIKDREGFDGGIVWTVDSQQVTGSQNISKSVTVNGKWMFNTPKVDIGTSPQNSDDSNFNISPDGDNVSFVYDEYQSVHLNALKTHEFEGRDGFKWSTEWTKIGDSSFNNPNNNINLQNVNESGEYILKVTATSPFGDTSVSETRVSVSIAKKDLDIGTASLSNKSVVYDSFNQTLRYEGVFVHDKITVFYSYFDQDGNKIDAPNGVKNVGRYKVVAEFAKNNLAEAANYGTKELTAELVITTRELSFDYWSASEFTYNTYAQGVTLHVTGICGTDDVDIVYAENSNMAINQGNYVAKAIGVTNPNYSINTMQAEGYCTHSWKINPKEITVKEWKLDGSVTSSFKITYNGEAHQLEAVPEGVHSVDENNVKFIYDEGANTVSAIDANVYTAKIIGVTNENYVLASESTQSWEIEKRIITVYFDTSSTLEYNGKMQSVNAIIYNIVEADLESFDRTKLLYTDKSEGVTVGTATIDDNTVVIPFSAKNASVYNLAINGIDPAADIAKNYTMSEVYTEEITIAPKTITFINDGDYTYTGKLQTLVLKVDGIVAEDLAGVAFDQFTVDGAESGALAGNYYTLVLHATESGDYPVSITAFNNANYTLNTTTKTIKIKKQVLKIDWYINDKSTTADPARFSDAQEFAYNYFGYDVSAEISGIVNSDGVVLNLVNAKDIKNAGTYTTTAKLVSMDADVNKNYEFVETSITWKITPYVVNFTWNKNGEAVNVSNGKVPNYTYDKNEIRFAPVYKLLGDDTITISYASGYGDIAKTNASTTNYKVKISDLGNGNYVIGEGASFEWKINPQTISINWSASNVLKSTYNGDAHGIKFTVSGLVDIDGRYISAYIDNDGTTVNWNNYTFDTKSDKTEYSISGINYIVNAGEYVVYFDGKLYNSDGTVDPNYEIKCDQQTITVEKAPITLAGWQYTNGTSQNIAYTSGTTLIYNAKDYIFSNSIKAGLCQRNGVTDSVSLAYSVQSARNANSYTTTVTLTGTHANNYYIVSGDQVSWKIDPKVISVDWIVNEFVYNNDNKTQNATYSTAGATADDLMVYAGDSLTLSYSGNKYKNAGTYTAEITSLGNSNYTLADSSKTYTWSIAPQPITIKWSADSFTYNGAVQYPTASYSSSVRVTEYEMVQSKDAATYTIKPKSNTALNDSNYIIAPESLVAHTYTINPKPVTFSWGFDSNKTNASNYEYDGVSRVLNAYVSNLCSGDTVNVTYNQSLTERTLHDAKSYTASVKSIDNKNYVLQSDSTTSKTVTVSKRNITLSWIFTIDGSVASASNYTYDGKTRVVSANITNLCTGDTVTLNYTQSQTSRTIKNADAYSFSISSIGGTDAKNYQLNSGTSKDITVSKKELRFDWYMTTGGTKSDLANITYDGKTYTVTAVPTTATLVSGDSVTASLDVTNFKNAQDKKYSFTVTGLTGADAKNYSVPTSSSYKMKSITVYKQTVSIQWYDENNTPVSGTKSIVYDGRSHAFTAKVTAISNGSTVTLTPTYKNGTNSATNASTSAYAFEVSGLSDSTNYQLPSSGTKFNLQINAQPVKITWSGATQVTYDGQSHGLSATVVGANDGKAVNFTLSNNNQVNASTYTVTVNLSNSNYTVTGSEYTKQLVISAQTLTLKWFDNNGKQVSGNQNIVYDGKEHSLYAKAYNSNGDEIAITMSSGSRITNVTSQTYKVSGLSVSTNNYKLPSVVECKLTITAQPVKIVWTGAGTYNYNGQSRQLTAQVIGLNDGKILTETTDYTYNTTTASITNAGSLTRTVSLKNTNYTIVGMQGSTSATIIISPVNVTVTWTVDGVVYEDGIATIGKDGYSHKPVVTIRDENGNVLQTYNAFTAYSSTGTYNYYISSFATLSNFVITNGEISFYMTIE